MTTEPQWRERARRLARAALGLYGMGDDAEVELLRNDFVQVFRVRSATHEEFALRLYGLPEAIEETGRKTPSDDLRSPEVLRSQLLWLSALRRDTGLLVPEPVATLEGDLLGEVVVEDTPSGTPWRRRSALLGWVAGTPRHEDLSESDSKMAGALLAGIHDHSESYGAPEDSALTRWDWGWPFGEGAPLWDEGPQYYSDEEMAVFEEAAQRVRVRLEELGEGREVFGLIHRDPNLRNLLFSGEGVGIIDFDMCGLGHYLFDISVLRRSLNTLPEERRRPLWVAFLEGYEDVRQLPERIRGGLEGYLGVFDAMQRAVAVNRRLQLLGSGAAEPREAREKRERFLKTSQRWLSRRVQHMAMLPYGLDGLPYAVCELLAI